MRAFQGKSFGTAGETIASVNSSRPLRPSVQTIFVLLFLGFLHFGEEICSITLGGHASELVDIRSASG
jgi:hypothetical protein